MENQAAKSQSEPLLAIVAILAIVSIAFSFYKYYMLEDYSLYVKESCNPAIEECLSEECDPEDPRCLPLEDGLMYYKETYRPANSTK